MQAFCACAIVTGPTVLDGIDCTINGLSPKNLDAVCDAYLCDTNSHEDCFCDPTEVSQLVQFANLAPSQQSQPQSFCSTKV